MTKNESLQKALDALGPIPPDCCGCQTEWQIAITAIKVALEAKDEPEYYGLTKDHLWMSISKEHYDRLKPEFRMACYTTPPQRTWVGLTDEDYIKALELCDFDKDAAFEFFEAKLKELNT